MSPAEAQKMIHELQCQAGSVPMSRVATGYEQPTVPDDNRALIQEMNRLNERILSSLSSFQGLVERLQPVTSERPEMAREAVKSYGLSPVTERLSQLSELMDTLRNRIEYQTECLEV